MRHLNVFIAAAYELSPCCGSPTHHHMTLHMTLQELYNCLTDALVEYTYDTLWLGKAQGICKARQLSPDRLGWSGLDLYSLQPRILACYGPPCKTIEPWKHFWAKAMQDLPLHLALRVELALNAGDLSHQNDNRPDMKPYLAMLGMPCALPIHLTSCTAPNLLHTTSCTTNACLGHAHCVSTSDWYATATCRGSVLASLSKR